MVKALSALDIRFLVEKLKVLEDSRFDKVYQKKEKNDLLFQFYKPGEGKKLLRIMVPNFLFLEDVKKGFPQKPPGFAMFLRRRLSGSWLRRVEQIGFERIIKLEFEAKEENYDLLAEFIPPGNLVLTEKKEEKDERTIVGLLETQNYKDRTLRGGIPYETPPRQNNILEMSREELKELFDREKSVVKNLAANFSLGGKYAREICRRAEIPEEKKELSEEEKDRVLDEVEELTEEKRGDEINKEKRSAFREKEETYQDRVEEQVQEEKERLKKIITSQKRRIEGYKKESATNRERGEMIYKKYNELNKILYAVKEAKKEHTWDEIEEKLEEEGYDNISLDRDNNSVVVEVDED